ncbi:MAG: hypothetical protein J6K72_11120 [Clostridia bacterium]|nr:hypothetical protein [Clostridia bacterium]
MKQGWGGPGLCSLRDEAVGVFFFAAFIGLIHGIDIIGSSRPGNQQVNSGFSFASFLFDTKRKEEDGSFNVLSLNPHPRVCYNVPVS